MSLAAFLNSLMEAGRVLVADPDAPAADDAASVERALGDCDQTARAQMAGEAPEFVPLAARWAAQRLYQGCQLLAYRELGARAVVRAMRVACPQGPSAGALYSADLTLRYLGDLLVLARGVSDDDVLLVELRRLAREWPLSSVGVKDLGGECEPAQLEVIAGHPSLRQLYIDRVVARRDLGRLDHPGVREGVREAIGMFDALCPELAAAVGRGPKEVKR